MVVKCPRCGKTIGTSGNPFRPFCSERCKLIDLGNWISDTYVIPGPNTAEADDEASIPQKDPDKE